ncbi:unnamed protein product [Echinostoma caproni]|uniref:RUN domain-containing protein n=1 Tax=Echinostoma caproni TaxID=27848 RepID=A0A183B4D2_9TREM|nr:unnamed protein product [Echinostoma caproni]
MHTYVGIFSLLAELQELVDRYIPSQLFPWIADVPRRLAHYLKRLDKQCPWVAAALSKSDSAIIPNPELLIADHEATVQQMKADRDQIQTQLTSLSSELSSLRLVNTEQTDRIEQLEKQARLDKADLAKLKRNVIRYQDYLTQLLDPVNSASAMANIIQRVNRTPAESVDSNSKLGEDTPTLRSSRHPMNSMNVSASSSSSGVSMLNTGNYQFHVY